MRENLYTNYLPNKNLIEEKNRKQIAGYLESKRLIIAADASERPMLLLQLLKSHPEISTKEGLESVMSTDSHKMTETYKIATGDDLLRMCMQEPERISRINDSTFEELVGTLFGIIIYNRFYKESNHSTPKESTS